MTVERSGIHNQGSLPAVGTAYLAEVIYDGTNCTTYINGVLQGSSFASTGNFNINKIAVGVGFAGGVATNCPFTGRCRRSPHLQLGPERDQSAVDRIVQ